ncbi:NAC domain-containing protein 17-like [Durio zibethinus]|uniref:NAC domain-containing protein 17-like n=1 Tax=Durio zibethinus TaxID=66656 RepID=A0A6P6ASZ7_DURZI|nr:NAC domain-containing protein 17-like [Durio zibethinus]
MTAIATADSCFGDDQVWPPGFRFHPTDEELVLYYLKRKICRRKLKLDIIRETDVYKCDPEELPAQSILKTGDRQWFFFTPRDRKYPNGARSNRATRLGYWKATGKDRTVTCNSWTVGLKKTLVFYRGRAPNGERTDWVMHEYTLDEEELKRCQNAKDYYALYKVYKKSGPGPKNGEQYGATFKEEEWAEEEYARNPVDTITPLKSPNEAIPDDNVKANDQVQFPLNDIEEFMRQLADGPALSLSQAHLGYVLPQVVGEEETQSTLLDPSSRDVLFPEPLLVLPDQVSFEFSQPPSSELQLHEAPEVTSVANIFEQLPQICENFLEIDDLTSPEPLTSNVEKPAENGQQFNILDGLSEFDLYHDSAMFLKDIGPIDQETVTFSDADNMINQVSYQLESQSNISLMDQQLHNINLMDWQLQHQSNVNLMDQQLQPELNTFGDNQQLQPQLNTFGDNQQLQPQLNAYGETEQLQPQLNIIGDTQQLQPQLNAFGDNMLNQGVYQSHLCSNNLMDQQLIPHSTVEQVDYQLQFQSVGNELDQHIQLDQINGSICTHDQSGDVFNPSGSNLGNASPTSGFTHNSINQDQGDKNGGGASRFSSALWSFVESIPTTPARASESPSVNRAFKRMSSFSRLRLNAGITDASAIDDGSATARRTDGNRGFFLISILGALCAIILFLIGTVRPQGRSSISS